MVEEKKKRKSRLSWIEEVLSEDVAPLESVFEELGKETEPVSKKEEPTELPLEPKVRGLEEILKLQSKSSVSPPTTESEEVGIKPLSLQEILETTMKKPAVPVYGKDVKVLDVYGNVRILKVKGEPIPIYELKLPELSKEEEKLLKMVRDRAVVEIQIDPESIPNLEERRRVFLKAVRNMVREMAPTLSEGRIEVLSELIVQNMIGYGKLDPLVRDDNLEEIMVIGTRKPVYVWHRRFNMCKTNIIFDEDREILNIIERIAREVGRRIDQQSPLLDARLPDGSRVNATIAPISIEGPTLTIRKFKKDPLTIVDLIKYGTMNLDVAALFWIYVDGLRIKPANILIAGGTGSGKTTTLNSLAMFIPPSERVISIEDTAELQLPIEHWIRLETRPPNVEGKGEITMDDLVKNTLRMRPDRIIVGEVRGPEARTMFTAMNTGHDGALLKDELILLADGQVIEIGKFAERFFRKHASQKEGEFEWIDVSSENVYIKSFNKETFKIEDKLVTRIWRRKYKGKMLKIKTKSGKEITLTPDHPIYKIENGIVEINAERAKIGDYIALPRKISIDGEDPPDAYLIGALLGNGHLGTDYIDFVNSDEKVIEKFASKLSKFVDVKVLDYGEYKRVRAYNKEVVRKLSKNIPVGNKTRTFRVPEKIMKSNNKDLAEFIQGLFDSDAHVNERTNTIEFVTANRNLAIILPYLLLRFGIISHVSAQEKDGKGNIGPYYKICISGKENLMKFAKRIGFTHTIKAEKLVEILKKAGTSIDSVPNIGKLLKEIRKEKGLTQEQLAFLMGVSTRSTIEAYEIGKRAISRGKLNQISEILDSEELKLLADANVYWDKIVAIEEIEVNDYVYDLTVADNHTYIAGKFGGIIVSNCMGTIHSNSARETIIRLESPPMSVPRIMIPALDIIIMQVRYHSRKKGTIRRITEIAEVSGIEAESVQLNKLYKYDPAKDELVPTGVPSRFMNILSQHTGLTLSELEIEKEKRKIVLEWMVEKGVRSVHEVGEYIRQFYIDPEELLKRIEKESTIELSKKAKSFI